MYNGPKVQLTPEEFGRDGNAFAIMGVVINAIKTQLLLPKDKIEKIIKEYRERATSGNYDNLLAVSAEYVDFIKNDDFDDEDDDFDDDEEFYCDDCGCYDCDCYDCDC